MRRVIFLFSLLLMAYYATASELPPQICKAKAPTYTYFPLSSTRNLTTKQYLLVAERMRAAVTTVEQSHEFFAEYAQALLEDVANSVKHKKRMDFYLHRKLLDSIRRASTPSNKFFPVLGKLILS